MEAMIPPKKRIVTKPGDVFMADLGGNKTKYFQYAASDLSQLNSDVIRVFERTYSSEEQPSLEEVVNDEVMFYAHCVLKAGIRRGLWEKVGKATRNDPVEVYFRATNDYGIKRGEEPVKISERWYVWKINEPFQRVGKLEGEFQKAEIGVVKNPVEIITRMKTGKYSFFYPGF